MTHNPWFPLNHFCFSKPSGFGAWQNHAESILLRARPIERIQTLQGGAPNVCLLV